MNVQCLLKQTLLVLPSFRRRYNGHASWIRVAVAAVPRSLLLWSSSTNRRRQRLMRRQGGGGWSIVWAWKLSWCIQCYSSAVKQPDQHTSLPIASDVGCRQAHLIQSTYARGNRPSWDQQAFAAAGKWRLVIALEVRFTPLAYEDSTSSYVDYFTIKLVSAWGLVPS